MTRVHSRASAASTPTAIRGPATALFAPATRCQSQSCPSLSCLSVPSGPSIPVSWKPLPNGRRSAVSATGHASPRPSLQRFRSCCGLSCHHSRGHSHRAINDLSARRPQSTVPTHFLPVMLSLAAPLTALRLALKKLRNGTGRR